MIFVDDDSPNKTAGEIQICQSTYSPLELISGVGRNGLSSACIKGFIAAAAPFIAVNYVDLQDN